MLLRLHELGEGVERADHARGRAVGKLLDVGGVDVVLPDDVEHVHEEAELLVGLVVARRGGGGGRCAEDRGAQQRRAQGARQDLPHLALSYVFLRSQSSGSRASVPRRSSR